MRGSGCVPVLVSMTIALQRCSTAICQKVSRVCFSGPCGRAGMTVRGSVTPKKQSHLAACGAGKWQMAQGQSLAAAELEAAAVVGVGPGRGACQTANKALYGRPSHLASYVGPRHIAVC